MVGTRVHRLGRRYDGDVDVDRCGYTKVPGTPYLPHLREDLGTNKVKGRGDRHPGLSGKEKRRWKEGFSVGERREGDRGLRIYGP